ncbi:MAG: DEAD/DEAH box helicase [Deltaproteobacteria bacterium]|nr:DEAD/DEAH box helicase [Deltaproteobacteria bacterium]
MSTNRMDVFDLRRAVVDEYRGFATSFTRVFAPDIKAQVDRIYDEGRFWPEPLVQLNPKYQPGGSVAELCAQGALHPRCAEIFNISLYRHQAEAVSLANAGRSYVVTTGTGSGKSLCFFVPMVSAILAEKERDPTPRTRAIVIYPMNALANSQRKELEKYLGGDDTQRAVTFERYTGQESAEERQRVAANPPDILLTNFMMLELLMTRQDPLDRKVIGACAGLRFLVLDELHTYRGRQGADVALLVRRVRERLAGAGLQCIGTSATMKSVGTQEERARVVAGVASTLFAAEVTPQDVVREHVERVTDELKTAETERAKLGPALDAGLPEALTDAALSTHPLAIWVETRLGITRDESGPWHRAPPLTLSEAVTRLSEESGRSPEVCRTALQDLLLRASAPERERAPGGLGERPFFAFKLHQLISGAGSAYATLEPPPHRLVTIDGQRFHPDAPEKRLYGLRFCRACGQELHPVVLTRQDGGRFAHDRDVDDTAVWDEQAEEKDRDPNADEAGFLMLAPGDPEFLFRDEVDHYPETWRELDTKGNARLKRDYKGRRAVALWVHPDGRVDGESVGAHGGGAPAWFFPGRHGFCPRCGETHAGPSRDRNRLASLSAEGRSSATTTLVMSVLRWMHRPQGSGVAEHTRKLLGFSDNRQDAALQAGHFNDAHFVSLFRAAVWGALRAAGPQGVRADALPAAVQRALGFDRRDPTIRAEWMAEPHQRGANALDAERTLRDVLSYRLWHDQTGGWRFTNPNLEALGLLRVEYSGLDDLVRSDDELHDAPELLRRASPEVRLAVICRVLNHLRRNRAVASLALEPTTLDQLRARSERQLRAPWGISVDERPIPASALILGSTGKGVVSARDESLIVRGGARSALGQALKRKSLWGGEPSVTKLKMTDVDELLEGILRWCAAVGLVTSTPTVFDLSGWRLNESVVTFHADVPTERRDKHDNRYFVDLIRTLADTLAQAQHPLFGVEAREHTAQVDQDTRQTREKRFRYSPDEQAELAQRAAGGPRAVESARFLPVLFCSPTMELGVDISELMVVYMRNLPPTPANYAQRSGRAGRGGQAALVLTYASAQGPHDQYFFRQPKLMVHGEVRAPSLELANRELVESHLQAIWLACTEAALSQSVAKLLELNALGQPLTAALHAELTRPEVVEEAVRRMVTVLESLQDALTPESAPWFPGARPFALEIATTCARRFDEALMRWRALFRDAETQRDMGYKLIQNHSAPAREKKLAKIMLARAIDQLELLSQDVEHGASNDFNTYRYLATEGFLPGYNFPRLPLLAFIPRAGEKGRPSALQRPRFLGLSEFGPRSLVYHEGRAFRVTRVQLPVSARVGPGDEPQLPTGSIRLCKACGAGHEDEERSACLACHAPLTEVERVLSTFRVENLETWPVERITANDEERRRQGFELRTTFMWSLRDGVTDAWESEARDDVGPLATLTYGPRTKITRMNLGLRRRADTRPCTASSSTPSRGIGRSPRRRATTTGPRTPPWCRRSGWCPSWSITRTPCCCACTTPRSPIKTPSPPCSTPWCAASPPPSSLRTVSYWPSPCPTATPGPGSCSTRPPRAAPGCSRAWSPSPGPWPPSPAAPWRSCTTPSPKTARCPPRSSSRTPPTPAASPPVTAACSRTTTSPSTSASTAAPSPCAASCCASPPPRSPCAAPRRPGPPPARPTTTPRASPPGSAAAACPPPTTAP